MLSGHALSAVDRRKALQELARRRELTQKAKLLYAPTKREAQAAQALRNLWFDKQRAFFESRATRRVAFCTRRAGKTIGLALWFAVELLEYPSGLSLYLAQTNKAVKSYMWRELKMLKEQYDLPFTFNESNLWIKHDRGGGMIVLSGADKADYIENFRGPKWRKVALDESATFGAMIENLILEVIGPALRDEGGHLVMVGTAGRKKEGLFYEACHGLRKRKSNGKPVYELHEWTLQDNPHLSSEAKDLDLILDEEGFGGYDDPRFQREYLKIWNIGDTERIFAYAPGKNDYDELPEGNTYRFLLSMDFAWNDDTAIVVVAYSPTDGTIYFHDCWSKNHQYADDVAARVIDYRQSYGAKRYVGDVGGYGKAITTQLARDYGLHIEPAKKMEKLSYVEFLNSGFMRGDVKVRRGKCDKLAQQFMTVGWNETRTDAGNHEKDDLCFAATYGWRAAKFSGAGKQALTQEANQTPQQRAIAFATREKLEALRAKDNDRNKAWYLKTDDGPYPDAHQGGRSEWRDLLEGSGSF
ncbi:hypothetical protein Q3G72_032591 [Acer saccharum]|nr:hypothetical protein Q3G72_003199 [Acer saccharum]KAK1548607.1 hypothetical protein Q3G72_032591 [Acer saccharum]